MREKDRITYYDFASMNYASFFLTGFAENAKRGRYTLTVSRRLPASLRAIIMQGEWASIVFAIAVFRMQLDGKEFYFCIDARDSCWADSHRGMGYHLPLLEEVKLYFKVNYNEAAIRADSYLRAHCEKIVPVAPCFPLRPHRSRPLLSKLIVGSLAGGSGLNAASKARTLVQFPSLEEIRRFRHVGRDLDLFFVSAFYPEVQHRCDMEFRYQIIKEIKRHRELASIAAFAGKPSGPYSPFQCDRYTLRAYLRNLARARVAIYVRGLHGCLSFKIGQYLALGMPIVGQTILNKGSALCRDENISKQFAFGSPEEIVSRAVRLLREPGERKALGQANARAFDARLTPQATTADIMERLRLYASQGSAIADNISELRVLTKSPSTIGGW